jgi:ABC-type glycerol-3-phosphate transport system permease component
MAAVVVVTLPMLVIFFLFQNFFVEGVTVTGMKG